MEKKIFYKIVESKNDKIYTLFHGINGTREIQFNQWITAEIKENVMDGKGTTYTSGIHIIDGKEHLLTYLKRFKKDNRVIVSCYAEGLKKKEKSRQNVYLADKIYIVDYVIL